MILDKTTTNSEYYWAMVFHCFSTCEVLPCLTITSLSSMISAVKWYWGNWIEILSPSMVTRDYRGHKRPQMEMSNEFAYMKTLRQVFNMWLIISLQCLLLTHLEFSACHRRQLTFLSNGELVGPGPVGKGLCPGEVLPILKHLRYHFVLCLGIEEPCDKAGEI